MGLLSLYQDPFGKRYRRKSWGTTLGTTRIKKSINKAVFGPFRALSPSRHWKNFKQRVARKVGLRSEFAKAYRSGEWGKYAKRKLLNAEALKGRLQENYSPYGLTHHEPERDHRDSHQTSILHRGIFKKALGIGAIAGVSAIAARKFHAVKAAEKAAAMAEKAAAAKPVHGLSHVKRFMSRLHKKGKAAVSWVHENVHKPYIQPHTAPIHKAVGEKLYGLYKAGVEGINDTGAAIDEKFGDASSRAEDQLRSWGPKAVDSGVKRVKRWKRESDVAMPFEGSRKLIEAWQSSYGASMGPHHHEGYSHHTNHRSNIAGVLGLATMGAVGVGTAMAAKKLHATLNDPVALARKSAEIGATMLKHRTGGALTGKFKASVHGVHQNAVDALRVVGELINDKKLTARANKAFARDYSKAVVKHMPGISQAGHRAESIERAILKNGGPGFLHGGDEGEINRIIQHHATPGDRIASGITRKSAKGRPIQKRIANIRAKAKARVREVKKEEAAKYDRWKAEQTQRVQTQAELKAEFDKNKGLNPALMSRISRGHARIIKRFSQQAEAARAEAEVAKQAAAASQVFKSRAPRKPKPVVPPPSK